MAVHQEKVDTLIRNYRVRGHIAASLDPLGQPRSAPPELDPAFYGFTDEDMDRELSTKTVELAQDTGASIALPTDTALVRLSVERTSVRAALVVTAPKDGVAVVPLRELLVDGLVPDVRPSLR